MEHRWGHRRGVSRPVRLQTRSGVTADGHVTNVSISGAFVCSTLPVSLYSYLQVEFAAMLHGKRTRMLVEGQVVRRDNSGFGIEWCEFAPDAVRALVLTPPVRATEESIRTPEPSASVQSPASVHNATPRPKLVFRGR